MAFFVECSVLSKQKDIFTSLYDKLSVVDVFGRHFTYQFVESTDQIFRKLYNIHILRQVIVKIKMYEILNANLEKGNIIIMKNGRILFKKWSLNCINVYAYFEYYFSITILEVFCDLRYQQCKRTSQNLNTLLGNLVHKMYLLKYQSV